jgi:hypothetical protein
MAFLEKAAFSGDWCMGLIDGPSIVDYLAMRRKVMFSFCSVYEFLRLAVKFPFYDEFKSA